MKTRKHIALLVCLCLMITLIAGCGSSTKSANFAMSPVQSPMAETAAAAMDAMGAGNSLTAESGGSTTPLPQGRKWIITQNISVETDDLDTLLQALTEAISGMNGYIESQSSNNGSSYYGRRYRNAEMTIRIPAEKLDGFIAVVNDSGNVTRSARNAEDITLNYVDTQGRITALETEQARLLELMARAENMSDLLEIEGRLTEVRYRLESYSSQLRTMDNQVDYATIYMDLQEVTEFTPVEKPTFWQRIVNGFRDNLVKLWEFLQDLLVVIITNLPALILWGAVIFGIVKLCVHSSRKRRAKRIAKAMQTAQEQEPNEDKKQ